jgi:hypothetical protein
MADTKAKAPGYTRFGTLTNVVKRIAKNQKEYVRATVKITKKDGTFLFEEEIIAFAPAIAVQTLISAGNGARVRVYGYKEEVQQDGGKFSVQMLRVVDAMDLAAHAAAKANAKTAGDTVAQETSQAAQETAAEVDTSRDTEVPF